MSAVEAVRWSDAGDAVDILDQTRLPAEEVRVQLRSAAEAEPSSTATTKGTSGRMGGRPEKNFWFWSVRRPRVSTTN